jgi:hypothetical protein
MKIKKIINWLKLQKEGIFTGAVIGALLYWDFRYDIVKRFMLTLQIPVFPEWIGWAIIITLCAMVGALVDSVYKPKQ